MKKTFKRFLSVFLAVLMVITVIPMGVYAAEAEETEIVQVSELEESRDLYSKTYETSEDTNVVISAAVPIHYEEDGELKDIDNTLVKTEEDSSILTNAANAYNVELPKKYTDDSEIKVDYEDHSISFKLLNNVKSSKGDIAETEKVDVDESNAESVAYAESNMDKLSSAITYENLLPDTDFEYNVQPNALKENIILNKIPDTDYTVQYELNTGSLEAVLNEDNSISLFDEDKEIFIIEAPYMIDANDAISEDVTVSLEKSENCYLLTYTPDYSWLSSEDTVYPVTIDPTITILGKNSTIQNIDDTYVCSSKTKASKNYSNASEVNVAKTSSYESWGCYYINNLPTIPSGAKITSSSLNLFPLYDVIGDLNIALYPVSEDYDINTKPISSLTWKLGISSLSKASDLAKISGDRIFFDITEITSEWYESDTDNRVLVLKALETNSVTFASSEYINNLNKLPYYTVEYKYECYNGLNDTYQYHTQDANLAGTIYINDYTGNLVIERTDFTSNGLIGDLTFYIGNDVNTPDNSYLGNNTSINYYKTLSKNDIDEEFEYLLTNGDGSVEYINKANGYSVDKGIDEETGKDKIIVSYDKDDNKVSDTFLSDIVGSTNTKEYVLTSESIYKNYNNKNSEEDDIVSESIIEITYNANNKIDTITDSVSTIKFNYTNGILSKISQAPDDENNNLFGIVDENNEDNYVTEIYSTYTSVNNSLSVTIGINEDDLGYKSSLIEYKLNNYETFDIIDENGKIFRYTFYDNGKVKSVQEFSSGETSIPGECLTFKYGMDTTTISDGTNTYTEYFDLSGKLISIIDQNGNATFAQYKDGLISKVSQTRNSARNIADFYSFESSKDSFFKTNNGTVTVSGDAKFNGKSSVQLTTPAQTKAVFDNKIEHLDKNSTYTVSMWVKKDENTDCSLTLTNGDDSGIFTTVNSQKADGWQQFYCTIDTENSDFLNVALTIDNNLSSNNTVIYVDNMYIQKSPYLTNINLLKNGDFSNELSNWVTDNNNITVENEAANISTTDNSRLKIVGDYLSENSISQTVSITANAQGTKYTYGGWIKSVDVLPEKEGTNREISLAVYGIASDGTSTLLDKTTYSSYLSNWQYIESELTLPDDDIPQLKFVISYNYQTGYVMLDGLSLSQDELYTVQFNYDDSQNIIGITTNETTIDFTEKEDNENQSTYTSETTLEDITAEHLEGEDEPDRKYIKTITETITNDDLTESIVSKFRYENNGSLLTGEMSALGRWTEYGYDYFGNIASVKDANGNTVEYEYDNFQNLSAIINQFESKYIRYDDRETTSAELYKLKVQYTYTGNRLDKIETGNVVNGKFTEFNTYVFSYDSWGNMTKIFINDMNNPYIHYIYDETNYHQLNAIEYINGQELHYVYDDDGNIIYAYDSANTDGDTLSYSYYYYDDGTCYGKKDNIAKTIESYQDGLTTVKDFSGNTLHVYGYDTDGNLLEQIGNNYVDISETSNQISTTVNNLTNIVSTEYDDFGRVISEKIKSDNSSSYILREYTYYNNGEEDDELASILGAIMDSDAVKNPDNIEDVLTEIDEDVAATNLLRYLTYYTVTVNKDGTETKKLINEYRYLYYMNGSTLSYTVATDSQGTIQNGNIDNVDELNLYAYNSADMLYANAMYLYNYDSHGNISGVELNRDEEAENHLDFTYDENSGTALANALTGVKIVSNGDSIEIPISYDAQGNINKVEIDSLTNGALSSLNLNWSRGNVLDGISVQTPSVDLGFTKINKSFDLVDYEYDDNNLRTHKSIDVSGALGGAINAYMNNSNLEVSDIINILLSNNSDSNTVIDTDMDYIWRDGKLVGEEIRCGGSIFEEGDATYGSGAGKYTFVILYDQNDNAYGFTVNKTMDSEGNDVSESQTFYYLKDADNTIKAIIDSKGNKLVEYYYDSFGMVMGIDNAPGYRYLMLLNPLAYRDYMYDIESGMYYLQSRYYAPHIGRFISADNLLDTGSGSAMCTHLYSYCENNPINNVDPYGYAKINIKWVDKVIDIALIVIPAVASINSTLSKAGKASSAIITKATKLFNSYKTAIIKALKDTIKSYFSKDYVAKIASIVASSFFKILSVITILSSIGNFIEYMIDILDLKWDGYLDTSKIQKPIVIWVRAY